MASYTSGMTVAQMLRARFADTDAPTQADAAITMGVRQPSVNRWVNGNATPKSEHVPAVAQFLGVDEATVLAAIHLQKMRVVDDGVADRFSYLIGEIQRMRDLGLVPDHVMEREIEGVVESFRQHMTNEQFATAADTGQTRKPAKRVRRRPSPEPNE